MNDVDTSLRARHVRLVNILRRLLADPEADAEDLYYADYDQAAEAGRKLLEEEDAITGESTAPA